MVWEVNFSCKSPSFSSCFIVCGKKRLKRLLEHLKAVEHSENSLFISCLPPSSMLLLLNTCHKIKIRHLVSLGVGAGGGRACPKEGFRFICNYENITNHLTIRQAMSWGRYPNVLQGATFLCLALNLFSKPDNICLCFMSVHITWCLAKGDPVCCWVAESGNPDCGICIL